ncbi:MAG: hypothetical protein WDO17_07255 [Alphaproteobacteria bacterium]
MATDCEGGVRSAPQSDQSAGRHFWVKDVAGLADYVNLQSAEDSANCEYLPVRGEAAITWNGRPTWKMGCKTHEYALDETGHDWDDEALQKRMEEVSVGIWMDGACELNSLVSGGEEFTGWKTFPAHLWRPAETPPSELISLGRFTTRERGES